MKYWRWNCWYFGRRGGRARAAIGRGWGVVVGGRGNWGGSIGCTVVQGTGMHTVVGEDGVAKKNY